MGMVLNFFFVPGLGEFSLVILFINGFIACPLFHGRCTVEISDTMEEARQMVSTRPAGLRVYQP